eukprot:GEMP01114252.1.p1 GENE.GEMP01114252.1~~GEMP01114252.1.p1  ORF type:complete len:150 (+),score=33.11 GEMP01114252.1:160-609(+)
MQIFINRDCGHPVVLGVDLTEVVSDISAKIERKLTHRLGDHYYTFAGRIMEGGRQLSEYSVNDGATLHLRHRLVGGGKRRRLTQEHISAMQEGRRKARATQEPVPDSCEVSPNKDTNRYAIHTLSHTRKITLQRKGLAPRIIAELAAPF